MQHRRFGTHLNPAGAAVLRELVNQRGSNVSTPERSSHVVFVRELIRLALAQQVHVITSAVAAPSEDLLLPLT